MRASLHGWLRERGNPLPRSQLEPCRQEFCWLMTKQCGAQASPGTLPPHLNLKCHHPDDPWIPLRRISVKAIAFLFRKTMKTICSLGTRAVVLLPRTVQVLEAWVLRA